MSDHSRELFYFEDHLPGRQRPIPTSGITMTASFLTFLMQSRASTGYSGMGVITGRSGIGKSIAAQAFLNTLPTRAHTSGPGCVKIKVQHRSSALALARTLLGAIGDLPYGHNVYELSDEVALAVLRHDLELLLVDEADRLNADSYEVLRHVYDRTGCPIVLVGLPQILEIITPQEKFASRITMHLPFPILTKDEVLDLFLPELALPCWRFDPASAADRALGALIWQRCAPSLRRLRDLLQVASTLAQGHGHKRVTAADVRAALSWAPYNAHDAPQLADEEEMQDMGNVGGMQEIQDMEDVGDMDDTHDRAERVEEALERSECPTGVADGEAANDTRRRGRRRHNTSRREQERGPA